MANIVRVAPIKVVTDSPDSILDYLVQRTDNTIGDQVARADAVIVGEVQEAAGCSIPVREEDVDRVRAWLSGEAGGPNLVVQLTRVRVDEWLAGGSNAQSIDIAYVFGTGSRISEALPLFKVHKGGLAFLRKLPPDLPYSSYVPAQSYQLAQGERGLRPFRVTDYDEQGRPYTRDETNAILEEIAAVRWYAALLQDDGDTQNAALFEALSAENPRISHCAIRQLARSKAAGTGRRFREMLTSATQELRFRLMLGLWLLGERDTAREVLEKIFREDGKRLVLARWDLKTTSTEAGPPDNTLFGPDPAEVKGD